jgi:hypothetical protein
MLGALAAIAPGCNDDDGPCMLDVCGTGCVDVNTDPNNCGACFVECGPGNFCTGGTCESAACDPGEAMCGEDCIDLQSDVAHCGTCENACGQFGDCLDGTCAEPLVALRTADVNKGTTELDVFVVQDISLGVNRLETSTTLLGSRVIDHAMLPDGRVLLVAQHETQDVFELYLSSPRAGTITKLNPPLVAGGNVLPGVAFSADGTKVLYRADQDVVGQFDLYAVAIATPGASVKVNGALVAGGEVSRVFALNTNGSRATYVADQDTDDVDELYTVDLSAATPGTPVKLNPDTAGADIWDFKMSADGARTVYRSDHANPGAPELFVVELATPGTSNRINNALILNENYRAGDDYLLSGDTVMFRASDGGFDESLFLASTLGPTFESSFLAENTLDFDGEIRSDVVLAGNAVYFRKDITFGDTRLFKVDLATPNVLVPVIDTSLALDVTRLQISPNGQHLVFGAGGDGGEGGIQTPGTQQSGDAPGFSIELYYVDLTAALPVATPIKLANSNDTEGVIEHDFFVVDDGRVIFRGDVQTAGVVDVFMAHPSLPNTPVKIGPTLDQAIIGATDVSSIKRF